MTVGSWLLLIGGLALALYFLFFYRTFATMDPAEAKRFTSTANPTANLIGVVLVVGMFIAPTFALTFVLAGIAFAWIARATWVQHSKMREMAFDSALERRLLRITFLAPVAIICLLASKLWFRANGSS
jgi:uncharacterized membrane protein YidH (DUF202 family)